LEQPLQRAQLVPDGAGGGGGTERHGIVGFVHTDLLVAPLAHASLSRSTRFYASRNIIRGQDVPLSKAARRACTVFDLAAVDGALDVAAEVAAEGGIDLARHHPFDAGRLRLHQGHVEAVGPPGAAGRRREAARPPARSPLEPLDDAAA